MIYFDNLLTFFFHYMVYFNTTCTVVFSLTEFTLLTIAVLYLLNLISTYKNALYSIYTPVNLSKNFNSKPELTHLLNLPLYKHLSFLNYLIIV
jgi:hypothetical protein